MKKRYSLFLVLVCFSVGGTALAQAQVPTGRAISIAEILTLTESIGGFLMTLGGIIAGIAIIAAGFMYMFSGSSPQNVATAKNILKAGIIGALIIFSTGLIINTIRGFAIDPMQFFGGGGGGGGNNTFPNGSVCTSGNDCQSRYCNLNLTPPICQ